MKKTKKAAMALAASGVVLSGLLVGCSSDADVVDQNMDKECEQFNCARRVVFVNGVTDKYILSVEGRCNIHSDNEDHQLEVICKVDNTYKKHFFGLSDNSFYFVEQLNPSQVSASHYKVIFKPSTLVPDVDVK